MTQYRRHRLDANHSDIRRAVEAMGWLWMDCSQTALGFDALIAKSGRLVPIEVKDGAKPMSAQQLTPHEADVHATLKAHGVVIEIICSVDDCQVLGRCASGRYDDGGR